jgi:hypothetical protein
VDVHDLAVAALRSHPESLELRKLVHLPRGFPEDAKELAESALQKYPESDELKSLVKRLDEEVKQKKEKDKLKRARANAYG